MLLQNFCLPTMAVLGSAAGSSNVGSSIFDGNDQDSSPPGLVDLSSPPPVGFTGPVRIKADSSPITGSAPPKLVVERSPYHQHGAHGKSSSRSGTGGSKAPKHKLKYKGSSGSYAIHGNLHSDQTSAAVPSMKNPFSFLVRRSEASNPVVIPGSIVEAYNDHGDTKSVVLPDIVINATDDVSAARQKGFLAGYKDGWSVGEAIQEQQQQVMGPCMGSYSLFGAGADPCHSRWIDLFVAVPMIVGVLAILGGVCAGVETCSSRSKPEAERQQKSDDQPDKDVEMAMFLHAEEWETADEGSEPEDWKSAAENSEAHGKMTSYW